MVYHIPGKWQASAEPSTYIAVMESRVFCCNAQNRGDAALDAKRVLRACPDIGAPVF